MGNLNCRPKMMSIMKKAESGARKDKRKLKYSKRKTILSRQ